MTELLRRGKVRDIYRDEGDTILVASDRISVYDVVLPTAIPYKGQVLTRLSLWWFNQLSSIPNHVISATDVPPQLVGRAIRCRTLDMVPVECVVRGFLAGSALAEYQKTDGTVSGVRLPDGLVEGDPLPTPMFTPTTKAPLGQHDQPMSFDDLVAQEGGETAEQLRATSLEVYRLGTVATSETGILIADTKIEMGRAPGGSLLLADEVLTPDSSRLWSAEEWRPGGPQASYDKQHVRRWAIETGWDRQSPGPAMPPDLVAITQGLYFAAYERITGERWAPMGVM